MYCDNNHQNFEKKSIYSESKHNFNIKLKQNYYINILITFRVLGNVTNAIVNVDEFKIHLNKDGSVDKTKTDLYLHLVDKIDNSILEVSDVLKIIDSNIEQLDGLFKEFNVIDTQPAEALPLTSALGQGGPIMVSLVISNLFIGALLIVVVGLCMSQRRNYKRQLRAARVNAYGRFLFGNIKMIFHLRFFFVGPANSDLTSRGIATRVPNTNKHSMEGSNPIWLKAYTNEWFKNDEDVISNNSAGTDSLDENVLTAEEYSSKTNKHMNGINTQNNLSKQYNVYHQIEKLTSSDILKKKLETTEL